MAGSMTIKKSDKILSSKEEIKSYIGGISNHLFYKYIKCGLPARYEDNRWTAHTENIDNFFRAYTMISMGKVIDQISYNGEED
jgi:hypothetical protein